MLISCLSMPYNNDERWFYGVINGCTCMTTDKVTLMPGVKCLTLV